MNEERIYNPELEGVQTAEVLADDFFEEKMEPETIVLEQPMSIEPEVWHTQDNIALSAAPVYEATTEAQTIKTFDDIDAMFSNLSSDVEGANKLISNIISKRKTVEEREQSIVDAQERLTREQTEFEKFVKNAREAIELEKKQVDEYVRVQKLRLQDEESQFKADVEVKSSDLNLKDQALQIEQENLDKAKSLFAKYKSTEEEKIESEWNKFEALKIQHEKDNKLQLEAITNDRNSLKLEREHFEKAKKIEEEKLAFEKENLAQNCNRFKELVSQFNSEFEKLPEDNK